MRSIAKRLVTTKYAAQSADGKTSYAGSTQGEPLGQSGSGSPAFLRLGHSLPIGQVSPRLFADAAPLRRASDARVDLLPAACGSPCC
jgi:hypothetical protein